MIQLKKLLQYDVFVNKINMLREMCEGRLHECNVILH